MAVRMVKIAPTARKKAGSGTRFCLSSSHGDAGSVTVRELFAGMRLALFDLRDAGGGLVTGLGQFWGGWGLLHCQRGSGSCQVQGKATSLAQGQVAYLAKNGSVRAVQLPDGRFRGMGLAVHGQELAPEVPAVAKSFFGTDLSRLADALSRGGAAHVLQANLDAEHVFSELYSTFAHADQAYLRIKCFELLFLYGRSTGVAHSDAAAGQDEAVVGKHVAIAYRAQAAMVADLAHAPTISELARACSTSPTVLKEAFRESFGMPVYTWFRTYRMRRACQIMEEDPARPIAEVAAEVGYANPSKFAKAFSDCMGTTPLAWRAGRGEGR